MPQQALNLIDVNSSLDQALCKRMSKIVEVKSGDLRLLDSQSERAAQMVSLHWREGLATEDEVGFY